MTTQAAERRIPGETGMWLFVVGDLWIFTCYFAAYLADRRGDRAGFLAAQQHLSQAIGVTNTVLLLTSSLLVALAVQARRDGRPARLATAGIACGAAFLALKATEWALALTGGHPIDSGPFWMYYYMLTGLHALHVILGVGLLEHGRRRGLQRLEAAAVYWHLVDLLWIVLYALLYLAR